MPTNVKQMTNTRWLLVFIFSWISWDFRISMDVRGLGSTNLGPAPKETCAQLAAISMIFIDFRWFYEISWFQPISGVQGQKTCCHLCHRGFALKETFTRSKLAAISTLFIYFPGFQKSWGFSRIARVQGQKTCCHLCHRGPGLKETFTRSQLAVFFIDFPDFMRFHGLPRISMVQGQTKNVATLQTRCCSQRTLYSISACDYFIDLFMSFRRFDKIL